MSAEHMLPTTFSGFSDPPARKREPRWLKVAAIAFAVIAGSALAIVFASLVLTAIALFGFAWLVLSIPGSSRGRPRR